MRIYIVRSAQCLDGALTQRGAQQADYLGQYLQYLGFRGRICAMMLQDAQQTARIVADRTGGCIQKWDPDAQETPIPEDETVFIGSKAAALQLIDTLAVPKKSNNMYNCALTWIDPKNRADFKCMDVAHLPNDLVSDDASLRTDLQKVRLQQCMEAIRNIPRELEETASVKLLHIGDTPSYGYAYYETLIQRIKPDILIHTGDFVDEIKAGRMPAFLVQAEYEAGLARMGEILKKSGARTVYAVPGNNDIVQLMEQYLSFAQIIEPNTLLTIAGVSCNLGHAWYEATKESQWSFYGHGLTGETWKPELNTDLNGKCRFNASWGATLILPEEGKLFSFPGI